MEIINNTKVSCDLLLRVITESKVESCDVVLYLDNRVNSLKADYAKEKIAEYRSKGWTPLPFWQAQVSGEDDPHACMVHRDIIGNQSLPQYAKAAIGSAEVLVYLDSTWTTESPIALVVTLAHELRHVWQSFNLPVVLHSQTTLSWVMKPQRTPCELDAESTARALIGYLVEMPSVRNSQSAFAHVRLSIAKRGSSYGIPNQSVKQASNQKPYGCLNSMLLKSEGQRENNFEIPGIKRLIQAAGGKLAIQLLP